MFKRFALLLTVGSALMLVTQVYGSCFNSPAQIMQIDVKWTERRASPFKESCSKGMVTCEYQGIKFLEGATFNTTDCFSCSCSSWGLSCCGFGIRAGSIGVPSGFRVVQYGCDFQIERVGGKDHLPRDTE